MIDSPANIIFFILGGVIVVVAAVLLGMFHKNIGNKATIGLAIFALIVVVTIFVTTAVVSPEKETVPKETPTLPPSDEIMTSTFILPSTDPVAGVDSTFELAFTKDLSQLPLTSDFEPAAAEVAASDSGKNIVSVTFNFPQPKSSQILKLKANTSAKGTKEEKLVDDILSASFAIVSSVLPPATMTATWGSLPPIMANVSFDIPLTFNSALSTLPETSDFTPVATSVTQVSQTSLVSSGTTVLKVTFVVANATAGFSAKLNAINSARGSDGETTAADDNPTSSTTVVSYSDFTSTLSAASTTVAAGASTTITLTTNLDTSVWPAASDFSTAATAEATQLDTSHCTIPFTFSTPGSISLTLPTTSVMRSIYKQSLASAATLPFTVYGALTGTMTSTQLNYQSDVDFTLSYLFNNNLSVLPAPSDFSPAAVTVVASGTKGCDVTFNLSGSGSVPIALATTSVMRDTHNQALSSAVNCTVNLTASAPFTIAFTTVPSPVAANTNFNVVMTANEDIATLPLASDFTPAASSVSALTSTTCQVTFNLTAQTTTISLDGPNSAARNAATEPLSNSPVSSSIKVLAPQAITTFSTASTTGNVNQAIMYTLTTLNTVTSGLVGGLLPTSGLSANATATFSVSTLVSGKSWAITATPLGAVSNFTVSCNFPSFSDGVTTGLSGSSTPAVNVSASGGNVFGQGKIWPLGVGGFVDQGMAATNLTSYMSTTGTKVTWLSFVNMGGTTETFGQSVWGGSNALPGSGANDSQIAAIRAAGGDIGISTGGYNAGIEPQGLGSSIACFFTNVQDVHDEYLKWIVTYNLTQFALDVEGANLYDTVSVQRRNSALKMLYDTLQAQKRSCTISYILPVLPSGLTAPSHALLEDAVAKGFVDFKVQIMAMDYGMGGQDPGAEAISATTNTFSYLKTILPTQTDAEIWNRVGTIPMIGYQDTSPAFGDAPFLLADVATVGTYISNTAHKVAYYGYWSIGRDNPGVYPPITSSNNGTTVPSGGFGSAFGAFSENLTPVVPFDDGNAGVPTNLSQVSVSGNGVRMAWDYAANCVAYSVKRATSSGGTFTQVGVAQIYNTFLDVGLTTNTTYYYKVAGINEFNEVSADSAELAVTTSATSAVPNVTAFVVNNSLDWKLTLSWTVDPSIESVIIKRDGVVLSTIATTSGVLNMTYQDLYLDANTSYTYDLFTTLAGDESSGVSVTSTTSAYILTMPEWSSSTAYSTGDIVKVSVGPDVWTATASNGSVGLSPLGDFNNWNFHFPRNRTQWQALQYLGARKVVYNGTNYAATYYAGPTDIPGAAPMWVPG